ncbi:MAG: Gamma-glutamyltransferase [Pedosphaera sp.]|nr:Gamma-glutamyltransferase [Pedosphaera sp.]
MRKTYSRREMLSLTSKAVIAGAFLPRVSLAAPQKPSTTSSGVVTGDPTGNEVGNKVLAQGGNAIDAVIAAALATCVVAESKCGAGGYGGHMTIALAGGKKVTSIDFNSVAPAAGREDMFTLEKNGKVRGYANSRGWLAAGVPGTLAGMQLALDRYGTKSFRELAAPAIALARDGFPLSESMANAIRSNVSNLKMFPGSAQLFLKEGEPYKAGETFRNPDLAKMFETLAERNSVESFYRGDIAEKIAAEFKKNGGILTAEDLASYKACEVKPLELKWNDFTIYTAPLTAGGLSVLQVMAILKALDWGKLPTGITRSHARLEALRVAWRDRLALLGDPEKVKVPIDHLLSGSYAKKVAEDVKHAVKAKKPLSLDTKKELDDGTMNLSSVDRHGNMVAMTLTQGGAFGSKVTVEGLGVVLGHGMSRFEPQPGHPNSVAPGKRPLHNMCPTVVLRKGKPVMAVGAAGGRMIPNSIFDVLTNYVALGKTMEESVAAPRWNSEGDMNLKLERAWPEAEAEFFKSLGYKVDFGKGAYVSAVSFDPKTGEGRGAER